MHPIGGGLCDNILRHPGLSQRIDETLFFFCFPFLDSFSAEVLANDIFVVLVHHGHDVFFQFVSRQLPGLCEVEHIVKARWIVHRCRLKNVVGACAAFLHSVRSGGTSSRHGIEPAPSISIRDFPDATVTLPTGSDKNSLCYQMYYGCDGLVRLEGKKLFSSSTSMTAFCFQDMFSTCKNLSYVPSDFLPATTLAESCYRGMFQSTAIETAPELLATTLAPNCYRWMFTSCSKLNLVICYGSPGTGDTYTNNWLSGVAATGTFKTPAESTWGTGIHGIPSDWTRTTP